MSGIATIWDPANDRGDFALAGTRLAIGGDLETAVLISLFTDRVAEPDDVIPDGSDDPRGWWADSDPLHPIGSRMWLLARAKLTPQTAVRAKDYLTEAVQWLIDDGVVAAFDITVEIQPPRTLAAKVIAIRKDGSRMPVNCAWVWQEIA